MRQLQQRAEVIARQRRRHRAGQLARAVQDALPDCEVEAGEEIVIRGPHARSRALLDPSVRAALRSVGA